MITFERGCSESYTFVNLLVIHNHPSITIVNILCMMIHRDTINHTTINEKLLDIIICAITSGSRQQSTEKYHVIVSNALIITILDCAIKLHLLADTQISRPCLVIQNLTIYVITQYILTHRMQTTMIEDNIKELINVQTTLFVS